MQNNNWQNALSLLTCLLPLCLSLAGIAGIGAFAVWLFRRTRVSGEAAAQEENLRASVEALMKEVRPWQPEALADLHTFRRLR
ncbi:MAG TPA: hypothetical protein EYH34_13430, partial [Planctomycetes bacterium]|nr:hypothetical protein [Planctomycetota bacterium]